MGYPVQLRKFKELLAHYDVCHDRRDVGEFFVTQVVNYFISRPGDRGWLTWWEVFEDQIDDMEASGRGDVLLSLIEDILLQTQQFLPEFNEGPNGLIIDEAEPVGYSSVMLTIRKAP